MWKLWLMRGRSPKPTPNIKRCWSVCILAMAFACFSTAPIAAPTPLTALDQTAVESFIDGVVTTAIEDHRIPGVTISIIHRGEPILIKGYGFAREPEQIGVDPERHLFRVASITKIFNSIGLLQQVEQGRIDLDADFTYYLPDIAFDLPKGTVRVRDLLTHSAGFEDSYLGHFWAIDADTDHSLHDYVARFQPNQVRAPGERVVYSNYGTSVIGLLIETLSGMPYADYMETHVLRPLGMEHSYFRDWTGQPQDGRLSPAAYEDLAYSYAWSSGRFQAPDLAWMHAGNMPAGGLISNAADMARFMISQLGDGGGVLQPETLRLLHEASISNHADVGANALGYWVKDIWGYRTLEHGGSIFGFMSNMVLFPDLDLGIFVSTNTGTGFRLSSQLPHRFVKQFFPHYLPSFEPDMDRDLTAFHGLYRAQRRGYKTIDKLLSFGGELTIGSNDQGFLTLTQGGLTERYRPFSEDTFINPDNGNRIAFSSNNTVLLLHNTLGHNNFERLQVWETTGFATSIFMLAIFMSLVWFFVLTFTRNQNKPEFRSGQVFRYLSFAVVLAWAGFVWAIQVDGGQLGAMVATHFAQWPTFMGSVWILLARVITLLTFAMVVALILIWYRAQWGLGRRITASIFTVNLIVLVGLLGYWNILTASTLG